MTNEAIQNREPFLQNLREKLGVEKQPVSAHPFEPVNHLPEEQLADKTPADDPASAPARPAPRDAA